eukprot:354256-Chlamydomonas_euryale.AAC.9
MHREADGTYLTPGAVQGVHVSVLAMSQAKPPSPLPQEECGRTAMCEQRFSNASRRHVMRRAAVREATDTSTCSHNLTRTAVPTRRHAATTSPVLLYRHVDMQPQTSPVLLYQHVNMQPQTSPVLLYRHVDMQPQTSPVPLYRNVDMQAQILQPQTSPVLLYRHVDMQPQTSPLLLYRHVNMQPQTSPVLLKHRSAGHSMPCMHPLARHALTMLGTTPSTVTRAAATNSPKSLHEAVSHGAAFHNQSRTQTLNPKTHKLAKPATVPTRSSVRRCAHHWWLPGGRFCVGAGGSGVTQACLAVYGDSREGRERRQEKARTWKKGKWRVRDEGRGRCQGRNAERREAAWQGRRERRCQGRNVERREAAWQGRRERQVSREERGKERSSVAGTEGEAGVKGGTWKEEKQRGRDGGRGRCQARKSGMQRVNFTDRMQKAVGCKAPGQASSATDKAGKFAPSQRRTLVECQGCAVKECGIGNPRAHHPSKVGRPAHHAACKEARKPT